MASPWSVDFDKLPSHEQQVNYKYYKPLPRKKSDISGFLGFTENKGIFFAEVVISRCYKTFCKFDRGCNWPACTLSNQSSTDWEGRVIRCNKEGTSESSTSRFRLGMGHLRVFQQMVYSFFGLQVTTQHVCHISVP
ncbi:hypothetical protein TNCV_922671 [Trichonephila clavipes]|nr:hypothetical protein TNCV_922671 [Trichonephila clavipes]